MPDPPRPPRSRAPADEPARGSASLSPVRGARFLCVVDPSLLRTVNAIGDRVAGKARAALHPACIGGSVGRDGGRINDMTGRGAPMTKSSLEAVLAERGNPVRMLRDSKIGVYVYPVVAGRVQQLARRAAGLARHGGAVRPVAPHGRADRRGAGCRAVPEGSAINSFAGFRTNRAKHFVPVGPDGYVIGDMICSASARTSSCWSAARRRRTGSSTTARSAARREDHPRPALAVAARRQAGRARALPLPDPGARTRRQIFEKLNGGPVPDIRFFHVDAINVAGRKVRGAAPRHGRRARPRDLGTLRREGRDPRRRSCERRRDGVRTCARSARAPMRPTRSNRAGSPRRCRRSTPARR